MTHGPIRLQKFLSSAGVSSRRAAEELITEGRVRLNGKVVTELGTKVDPQSDSVEVDGKPVHSAAPVWIALHKPVGYVTTRSDPQRRPTVYDLLPERYAGLFHVGRLDVMSEGLVLMTNQGDLANRLLHPRYEVDRVYDVELDADLTPAELRQLTSGVELEDGPARVHKVERGNAPAGQTRLRVTMREGRNREVRRIFAALGKRVLRLRRRRYGPISLGFLPAGEWRRLTQDEIDKIAGRRAVRPSDRRGKPTDRKPGGAPGRTEGGARRRGKWKSRGSGS